MAQQDLLISWLNDAHGMEESLIPILENHAKDARDHPQMQERIQEHLEQTRRHSALVKECVERLGGSTSTVKSGMSTVMGKVQSVMTGAAEDELVKNGIADYAAENFEIASYTALIAGAQQVGDQHTVQVCQQILHDEQNMAQWLADHLPGVAREIIQEQ